MERTVKICLDRTEIDEVKILVDELNSSLEKANSLLNELASKKDITITVQVKSG